MNEQEENMAPSVTAKCERPVRRYDWEQLEVVGFDGAIEVECGQATPLVRSVVGHLLQAYYSRTTRSDAAYHLYTWRNRPFRKAGPGNSVRE